MRYVSHIIYTLDSHPCIRQVAGEDTFVLLGNITVIRFHDIPQIKCNSVSLTHSPFNRAVANTEPLFVGPSCNKSVGADPWYVQTRNMQ